jgi:hypothetical protein
MTNFPRVRGRILQLHGHAIIAAQCPLCAKEHRYDKGLAEGAEIEQVRLQGFSDEWMPCQWDLPGNFWRVMLSGHGRKVLVRPDMRAREHR